MLTDAGPKLLEEYNARFMAIHEAQAILVRLKSDLASVFEAISRGTLGKALAAEWSDGIFGLCRRQLRILAIPEVRKRLDDSRTFGSKRIQEYRSFMPALRCSPEGNVTASGRQSPGVATLRGITLSRKPWAIVIRAHSRTFHWPGMQFRRDIGKVVRN